MSDKYMCRSFGLFAFLLLIMISFNVQAQAQQTDALKVGVAGGEPFVVDITQQSGIALEIWQSVASRERLNYKLTPFHTVSEALSALEEGKLDAVVGPISITPERARHVEFTQPYYQSSLSIMSRKVSLGFFERIGQLLSFKFLYGILGFLFILAIVGTLLWLAEHKVNPDEFSSRPARGIGDGMWCAIVTMTTTGYGDISPRTLGGRIIAGSWMVLCIVFATTMIAGIASSLSLAASDSKAITKAEQLAHHKVAVVKGSPSANFVKTFETNEVYVENLKEAYDYLKSEKVDAIVFDRPQMLYFLKKNHDDDVTISQNRYMRQGYGFAVPQNKTKLPNLDIAVLRLQQSGRINRIVTQWLGENN